MAMDRSDLDKIRRDHLVCIRSKLDECIGDDPVLTESSLLALAVDMARRRWQAVVWRLGGASTELGSPDIELRLCVSVLETQQRALDASIEDDHDASATRMLQ